MGAFIVKYLHFLNTHRSFYMRSNYSAWTVATDAYDQATSNDEKLKHLLRLALLAPSANNSQPWKVHVEKDTIIIRPNPQRILPISDNNQRQLHISLGCLLEHLLIAADYYGYVPQVKILTEDSTTITVFIGEEQKSHGGDDHLVHSFFKRSTNRGKYRGPVSESLLQRLKQDTAKPADIIFISESEQKQKLAKISVAATIFAMSNPEFRKELSGYIKSNITSSGVGIPVFGMFVPTLLSLFIPYIVKYINIGKKNAKRDLELLTTHTPVIALLCTPTDDTDNWIHSGRVYARIALLATREGLTTGMSTASIQMGSFFKELQEVVRTKDRPQAFFRLGYPTKIPHHSPRLSLEEVLQ